MSKPTLYKHLPLVVGHYAGRKVRCLPGLKPVLNKLLSYSRKEYWTHTTINLLYRLSTGSANLDQAGLCPQESPQPQRQSGVLSHPARLPNPDRGAQHR